MKFLNGLRNQPILTNIASLGFVQMANYIIPILIIPFVTRALGIEFFGKASYAQNIIAYLTIIVNYGFEYSATQDIAIHREDKSKVRTIFWTVIRFKSILLFFSFCVLAVLYFSFSKVHGDPLLYFYAALINVGFVLFPTWFFQGIERMKNMAIFNFAIKALGAVLIVLLIRVPEDYRLYLLILSLSYVVVGVFSFFYVIKRYELRLPDVRDKSLSGDVIKKGFPIFLNTLFVSLYTTAGLTIVGFYLSDHDIGLYAGAHKIIMAVMMLTSMPVNVSLFPMISRKFNESFDKGWVFFKKCLLLVGVGGVLVSFLIFLMSGFLVQVILGSDFVEATSLLRLFSPLPFLVIFATMLTVQGLYGMQMQRYAPLVGILLGLSSVVLNFVLVPKMGVNGAAIVWITVQILEILCVGVLLKLRKKKIV